MLSADGFNAFQEAGLSDGPATTRTGMRYRATVLALGGGVPPGEVFVVRHASGSGARHLAGMTSTQLVCVRGTSLQVLLLWAPHALVSHMSVLTRLRPHVCWTSVLLTG